MNENMPIIEFAFPGPVRDQLLAAIESGAKTSTSALLRGYELADDPLPHVGRRGSVVDSEGKQRLVIETTAVDVVALRDVPLAHARAEGEGYESVADWRAGHQKFWTSDEVRAELGPGFEIDDDTPVVLENFTVVRTPEELFRTRSEPAALWVGDPVPRAQAFYRKNGFVPDGPVKIEDDSRELWMRRTPREVGTDVNPGR